MCLDNDIKDLLYVINTRTKKEYEYSVVYQYSPQKKKNFTYFYLSEIKRGLKFDEETGRNKKCRYIVKTYSLKNKTESLKKLAEIWEENKQEARSWCGCPKKKEA